MSSDHDHDSIHLLREDEDEGLFSRDINGQLVRLDAPVERDYSRNITLQIDGQTVTVPMAEPTKDANGNIVLDLEGRTTPRYTTIYDAATKLYVQQPGDEVKIPIPVLCHQPHMKPVAVCRLCVVQIYGQKRGKRAAERKLLPACQHQVKEGMEVFTMQDPGADGERVRGAVRTLTELLAVDNLKPATRPELEKELAPFNELGCLVQRTGANPTRLKRTEFAPLQPEAVARKQRLDVSSPVFVTDHSACVLCDRCVRACNDVKGNNIIGRAGKGAMAAIGFDLDQPMGESNCVQCGECMVSCPTSAITFNPVAAVKPASKEGSVEKIAAAELLKDPLFAGIPPKFLLWQEGLVMRRKVRKGTMLMRQGEAGNTAFIMKSGRYLTTVYKPTSAGDKGFFSAWMGQSKKDVIFEVEVGPQDVIVGEMSCLSGSPRSADLKVLEDGEVWEIRRNVLDRLMRLPSQRERFEKTYRDRSLNLVLQASGIFHDIPKEESAKIVDYMRHRITFLRINPGQVLFNQGDPSDCLYIVRLGYTRIGIRKYEEESTVVSRGPGGMIGEIGMLGLAASDAFKTADEVERALLAVLNQPDVDIAKALPTGLRTASCSALGQLEVARLSREDFLPMLREFPTLRRRLVERSLGLLSSDRLTNPILGKYVSQGLYEGSSILALDMDLCIRCDECTKGCVQQHGTHSHGVPVTRLLRDGMRLGNFMVATSCRSCVEAHCMVGCPVDSIHRGKHLQIVIEDHCIGCGLCANNCPYGSIFMVPNERNAPHHTHSSHSDHVRHAQPKAVACDLCDAEGHKDVPEPRCVSSCPHDAAHRYTGDELLKLVLSGNSSRK